MFDHTPKSLSSRLILSHLLVGIVSILLISAFASYFILDAGQRELEHTLDDEATSLSNSLIPLISAIRDGQGSIATVNSVLQRFSAIHPGIYYTIYQAGGSVWLTNEMLQENTVSTAHAQEVTAALSGASGYLVREDNEGNQTFYLAVPMVDENGVNGAIRLSTAMKPAMSAAYRSLTLLLVLSFIVLVGVGLEGWLLSNMITNPINSLTNVASRLSGGELHARAVPAGPRELRQLALTFNQMASQLQANLEGLQAFVDNASHELRTPLTAVKLNVEALRQGAMEEPALAQRFLTQIENEIDRLNRIVSDMLDLSRIEANHDKSPHSIIDLEPLIAEAKAFWQARAENSSVDLRLRLAPHLMLIKGNEDQLRQLINNLLDNAIKNTPSGGWVEVSLFNEINQQRLRLEVRDSGRGISEEHLPHIFERFYRAEAGPEKGHHSAGSGLGLTIAKSIVEAHAGQIGATSKPGIGATIWVELPAQNIEFSA
jgi:signal transduction histidine kinase